MNRPESPSPPPRRSRLGLLWGLLEGERARYLAAIGCTLAAAVFGYGTRLAVQAVLDGVLAEDAAERAGDLAPAARMTLDLLGGREHLGEHLWLAGAFIAACAVLVFDRVFFRHQPEAAPALDGVSFCVDPGETVALLGPSGSGKSTLIDLLLRLDDPQEGRIELDGVDLARLPRREARDAEESSTPLT